MDKLKMQSLDVIGSNIEKIQKLFPNCVTERLGKDGKPELAIDFEKLQAELSNEIIGEGEERYQFTWPDKRAANRLANTPTTMTLRPCREESVDFDHTQNLYIEGDNLDVLKALRETYLGKVKMIYIDPPYNTGNDFVYNDDFTQSRDEFEETSGLFDEEGNQTIDPMQRNTERNGRFHTDWLNMIYPRLKVSRDLLTDDGVIFISIDENELENLKKICDEIFGQSNFIAHLIWAAGRKNDSKYISVSHEYIVCYFKNVEYIKKNKIVWRERKGGLDDIYKFYNSAVKKYGNDFKAIEKELKKWYKNLPDGHPAKDHSHYNRVDKNGIFFPSDISWPGGGGPKYQVLHPITKKTVKIPARGWITSEENMEEWIKQGRVCFAENEQGVPTLKSYLKESEMSVPYSVFYKDGRASSKRLAMLMGDKVFENPKDEEIIQRLIEFCGTSNGDIILDFFSGSATTAHSVFLTNANKSGNRRFILVQLPEIIDPQKATSEKSKKVAQNALSLLESIGKQYNICEIGKERIRRAGQKIKEENKDKEGIEKLDTGFRVLKLDSSNMEEVYYTPQEFTMQSLFSENVKADRTGEDLLFQVMLDLGIELSAKIETRQIAGKTVHLVDDNYLVACFDRDVTEAAIKEIAQLHPVYFVMRDASAANDNVIDNFEQIFRHYSPDTNCRII